MSLTVFKAVDSNYTTLLATATSNNNIITDSSSNGYSITVNNDVTAGTFSPHRSGGYSTYFDGTGDRIHFVDSSLAEGTDDFTLECWFYLTANLQQNHTIFGHGATPGYQICAGNVNEIGFMKDGSNREVKTGTLNLNQWYHIVYQRASGTLYGFLDGVSLGTASMADNFTNTGIEVGVNRGGTEYFEGYIRDVRIVKGETVYNTNEDTFSPPTEPLVAVSGSGYSTTLLTCHKPYIVDGGANSIVPTIYNDVTTKPFSPYDYTGYSEADNGGSVFITGSSKLQVTSCDAFSNIGVGDYTLECWHYNSTNDSGDAIDFRNAGGGVALVLNSGSLKTYYTGSAAVSSPNSTVKPYQWNHLVFCRVSNVLKGYVNGKQVFTHNDFTVLSGSAGTGYIGSNAGSSYLNGYFSDVRMTNKGVYTGEFTPPTTPLSTTQSSGTNISAISTGECKVLVRGTDASIIDKSQVSNLKLVGNTTGSTTTKFTGAKSMYFDGTGDGIVVPHHDNLNLNSCDWTIEYWFNLPNPNAIRNWTLIQKGDNTTTRPYALSLRIDNSNGVEPRIFPSPNNSSQGQISNNAWQTFNNWHHVAFVRVNSTGVITRYINGTANGTVTSDVATNTEDLYIGTVPSASDEEGYIQDLRISKGKAHYTANFTPPAAPLEG